jgi:hypothetical protein
MYTGVRARLAHTAAVVSPFRGNGRFMGILVAADMDWCRSSYPLEVYYAKLLRSATVQRWMERIEIRRIADHRLMFKAPPLHCVAGSGNI